MRSLILIIAVFGLVSLLSYAQDPRTTLEQINQDKRDAELARRQNAMKGLADMDPGRSLSKRELAELKAQREAVERLVQQLKPSVEDEVKYMRFPNSVNGGLFRIFPDYDCVSNFVIRSDGQCEGFIDGGSAYSFRAKKYLENAGGYASLYPFSDIRFNQNRIFSKGYLEHGLMVSLGDVRLEDVTLSHPGLKFLVDLKPAATPHEADVFEGQNDKKIKFGHYIYSNVIEPVENTTYAMRMIAYKPQGVDLQGGELTSRGFKFLLLEHDKRADLTIVFRIVRRDADGKLTILWRELDRKKAPRLKF